MEITAGRSGVQTDTTVPKAQIGKFQVFLQSRNLVVIDSLTPHKGNIRS
jgi:hypothetical protein